MSSNLTASASPSAGFRRFSSFPDLLGSPHFLRDLRRRSPQVEIYRLDLLLVESRLNHEVGQFFRRLLNFNGVEEPTPKEGGKYFELQAGVGLLLPRGFSSPRSNYDHIAD